MTEKLKGTICGITAAISYGTNPLGALFLYRNGINTNSVLFYRYTLAAIILYFVLKIQGETLRITRYELKILSILGILFASSSITFYTSFLYLDAGIACTILFVYPIIVTLIMATLYGEKIHIYTILSIVLAIIGITLLYRGNGQITLDKFGVILVLISAITYAIYIVIVNRAKLQMSSTKLTFYALIFCSLIITIFSIFPNNSNLQILNNIQCWAFAFMLAIIPTTISLITMTIAVRKIGSTPTAIMGALEPITTIIIGIYLFDEILTTKLIIGILAIISAVIIIIIGKRKE